MALKQHLQDLLHFAEVSEGLIFKHFKSKNGLLSALLKIGASKSTPEIQKLKTIQEPKRSNIILH